MPKIINRRPRAHPPPRPCHRDRRLAKWAGIKANPHLFRHTSAVEHLRAGMNVFALRDHMGHESIKTTQGYLSALNDEDVEKQAQRTSPSDTWRL